MCGRTNNDDTMANPRNEPLPRSIGVLLCWRQQILHWTNVIIHDASDGSWWSPEDDNDMDVQSPGWLNLNPSQIIRVRSNYADFCHIDRRSSCKNLKSKVWNLARILRNFRYIPTIEIRTSMDWTCCFSNPKRHTISLEFSKGFPLQEASSHDSSRVFPLFPP